MNLFALLLLAFVVPPRPQVAEPSAHFKPIEFVVGSCWVGTFPGGKQTDEHCFEWVYGGKFVRDRHVVRGGAPYEGESLYHWDPAAKQLAFSYWNSAGQLFTGTVEPTPDGLLFPQKGTTEKGGTELRTVWTRTGPDGYRTTVSRRDGEAWTELWSMEFARKK